MYILPIYISSSSRHLNCSCSLSFIFILYVFLFHFLPSFTRVLSLMVTISLPVTYLFILLDWVIYILTSLYINSIPFVEIPRMFIHIFYFNPMKTKIIIQTLFSYWLNDLVKKLLTYPYINNYWIEDIFCLHFLLYQWLNKSTIRQNIVQFLINLFGFFSTI